MTQPLDVTFFKPLKTAWGKAIVLPIMVRLLQNIRFLIVIKLGLHVSAYPSLLMDFEQLVSTAIPSAKLAPSLPYTDSASKCKKLQPSLTPSDKLNALEDLIKPIM